jgi:sigma-B regulation protein RsbU (phosphoserine phosphatase)
MQSPATYPQLTSRARSGRVLVADDQPHILVALEILLNSQGYQTRTACDPAGVLSALQQETFDAVLMDLNYTRDTTGGAEGLDLVSRIRALDKNVRLIVMTAWSSVDLAVEAMRRGASDFVQKPWSNSTLIEKIREQVESCASLRTSQRRQEEEEFEAHEIQESFLPGVLPAVAGYDISVSTQSAQFVSGDYYDVARIGDSAIAFCVADAAGKGLPAALLMSNLRGVLKSLMRDGLEPSEVCSRVNRFLFDVMPENKFVSFFYGVLDSDAHRLTYCNAGHNPPLLVRSDGSVNELHSSGAVLGQFLSWPYGQNELLFDRGDTLLLFTDGMVEACNQQEEEFGEERLVKLTRESAKHSAPSIQNSLLQAVSHHCCGQFQDDATLIVLQRNRD